MNSANHPRIPVPPDVQRRTIRSTARQEFFGSGMHRRLERQGRFGRSIRARYHREFAPGWKLPVAAWQEDFIPVPIRIDG